MIMMYSLLCLMLLSVYTLCAIPFIYTKQSLFSKYYVLMCCTITITACFTYRMTNQQDALAHWLYSGKEHYMLLLQFQQLGGLQGMITRIQQKLSQNPHDATGWTILGKLYLANHQTDLAEQAFRQAQLNRENNNNAKPPQEAR